ncbi:ExbD/TolR family protein [Rhodophyticola sp. CCM32]|uniref:ExbD/TolR family protein n=1 Tax=Rhodophyticola sp. CCM32 TaxID=2916397 RepID=UPI003082D6FD
MAQRRRRNLSMTSLIDVIFLLLLFFMLSSTFTRFAELPLQMASGGTVSNTTPPHFLRLEADSLTLNGQTLSLEALPERIAALEPGDDAVLLVSTTADVTAQRLVDLLAILRPATGLSVRILE